MCFLPFHALRYPLIPTPYRLDKAEVAVLLPGLLGEPVIEHEAREADMPAYSMARQAASPHGLVDPARLDVQIPSGLLRAQEPILGQCSRWICC